MLANLKELIDAYDKTRLSEVIGFGKYKGFQLSGVPKSYISWARREITKTTSAGLKSPAPFSPNKSDEDLRLQVSKLLTVDPKELHDLYVSATSKATQTPINLYYEDLDREEQKIWEEMSSQLKNVIIHKWLEKFKDGNGI